MSDYDGLHLEPAIEEGKDNLTTLFLINTSATNTLFPRIIHDTHSPYTLGIGISVIDKFQHMIEEAKIVVGNPVLISNKPSGSTELANLVSEVFRDDGESVRAVIIKNHGVVAVGSNIDQTRDVVEALEECAKILTVSKIFGGPKFLLDNSTYFLKSLNGCDR